MFWLDIALIPLSEMQANHFDPHPPALAFRGMINHINTAIFFTPHFRTSLPQGEKVAESTGKNDYTRFSYFIDFSFDFVWTPL
jgi:hypothetical protein